MRRLKTGDQALEHCQTGRPSTPQNEPQTRGPVARNLLIGLGAGGRAPSFFFISARRKITKQGALDIDKKKRTPRAAPGLTARTPSNPLKRGETTR